MMILLGVALIILGDLLLCCIKDNHSDSISQDIGLALIRLVCYSSISLGTYLVFCSVMSMFIPFIQQLLNL